MSYTEKCIKIGSQAKTQAKTFAIELGPWSEKRIWRPASLRYRLCTPTYV